MKEIVPCAKSFSDKTPSIAVFDETLFIQSSTIGSVDWTLDLPFVGRTYTDEINLLMPNNIGEGLRTTRAQNSLDWVFGIAQDNFLVTDFGIDLQFGDLTKELIAGASFRFIVQQRYLLVDAPLSKSMGLRIPFDKPVLLEKGIPVGARIQFDNEALSAKLTEYMRGSGSIRTHFSLFGWALSPAWHSFVLNGLSGGWSDRVDAPTRRHSIKT